MTNRPACWSWATRFGTHSGQIAPAVRNHSHSKLLRLTGASHSWVTFNLGRACFKQYCLFPTVMVWGKRRLTCRRRSGVAGHHGRLRATGRAAAIAAASRAATGAHRRLRRSVAVRPEIRLTPSGSGSSTIRTGIRCASRTQEKVGLSRRCARDPRCRRRYSRHGRSDRRSRRSGGWSPCH